MQANTIITASLRKLMVIQSGKTPSTNQLTTGLEVLNDLLNSWSAEINMTYEDTFEELTIPSGTQSITIGSTGTLSTGRPLEIKLATIKDSGGNEYPLRIIGEKEYQYIDYKTDTYRPTRMYYRETWPDGTLYFESTTDQEYTLILTSMKMLGEFTDGTTEFSLPDYYERALKANLTIELADEMGAANRVSTTMYKIAEESKIAVLGKSLNIVPSCMELVGHGIYNIESDE